MSETRVVNGRIYTVTEIPQDDVDEIRERNGLRERVGSRPMVDFTTCGATNYQGRRAPKYVGERH